VFPAYFSQLGDDYHVASCAKGQPKKDKGWCVKLFQVAVECLPFQPCYTGRLEGLQISEQREEESNEWWHDLMQEPN